MGVMIQLSILITTVEVNKCRIIMNWRKQHQFTLSVIIIFSSLTYHCSHLFVNTLDLYSPLLFVAVLFYNLAALVDIQVPLKIINIHCMLPDFIKLSQITH